MSWRAESQPTSCFLGAADLVERVWGEVSRGGEVLQGDFERRVGRLALSQAGPGHIPVLADELVEQLRLEPGAEVLDCTVGLGGHAARLMERIGPAGRLVGLELDEENLEIARRRLEAFGERVQLFAMNMAALEVGLEQAGVGAVDAVVADLGLSPTPPEDAGRGFSFAANGPLDMRIDRRQPLTAEELVNGLGERELSDLIWRYSQERYSRRIARRICQVRRGRRIKTTMGLVGAICSAVGVEPWSRASKIHPATRTFLALRIAVNRELDNLEGMLEKVPRYLRAGGRIAVISFHSLEDGLVKRDFRRRQEEGLYRVVTKRPVVAGASQRQANPRSRSAKMRVAERTDQPMN
jgi:16S rRNA (cytosine1402-N4)-methyltransferase